MTRKTRVIFCIGVMFLGVVTISFPFVADAGDEIPSGGTVRSFADINYPGVALDAKVQGVVVIKATLDDQGNVLEVSVLSGSRALIPDCLSNAKKWQFLPNPDKIGIIVYDFEIRNGECHDASQSLFQLFRPNLASITTCTRTNDK